MVCRLPHYEEVSYPFTEVQLAYSAVPANRALTNGGFEDLDRFLQSLFQTAKSSTLDNNIQY